MNSGYENRRHFSMILSETSLIDGYTKDGVWGKASLDVLFRKNVRTHGDKIALCDPPNRAEFTCGPVRRLTYSQADEIIDDLTAMFGNLGLSRDDVVAVQMPNTVELPLLILACFRAGIIISILPLLWREHELENALLAISPKMLITQNVKGDFDFLNLMREIAVKVYSVRHIVAFGDDIPDGIVAVDKAVSFARENAVVNREFTENFNNLTANDVAVITWNGVESPDLKPLPRSHNHLISAGLAILLEASLEAESSILCPFGLSSLGALGSFFVPWILTGGSLHIHHPLDWVCYKQQLAIEQPTFTGLPPAALSCLCNEVNSGDLDPSCLKAIACMWPSPGSPETGSTIDTHLLPPIIDILSIGELVIFARCRNRDGTIGLIPHGECRYPSSSGNGPSLISTRLKGRPVKNDTAGSLLTGQLMIKSPMIYDGNFQNAGGKDERFSPLERDNQGFIATGIKCEIIDQDGPKLKPVDRLNDIVYYGGLAVAALDLDTIYSEFSGIERAVAVSISDPVLGERIGAAIIPCSIEEFSYEEFKKFLENRKLAPYKIPDQVITVADIPVDDEGVVIRQFSESPP